MSRRRLWVRAVAVWILFYELRRLRSERDHARDLARRLAP